MALIKSVKQSVTKGAQMRHQTPIFLPVASPLAALGSSWSQVQGEACIDVVLITEEEREQNVWMRSFSWNSLEMKRRGQGA